MNRDLKTFLTVAVSLVAVGMLDERLDVSGKVAHLVTPGAAGSENVDTYATASRWSTIAVSAAGVALGLYAVRKL